jgi:pilus assembly protein Flp/PilA
LGRGWQNEVLAKDDQGIRKTLTHTKKENTIMLELIKRFVQEEEGQDLVEYALLLVFIALIVIAALPNLGKTVSNVFSNATSVLQSGS